jgi:hypothetical protein
MSDPALPPSSNGTTARRAARFLVPVGAVVLALGGFAIAEAATDSGVDTPHDLAERGLDATNPPVDDGITAPSTGAPSPGAPVAVSDSRTEVFDFVNLPDGTTQTFVAAAGTVTIARSGATLTVVAVGANPGWVTEIERLSGPEVEVVFRNGTARIDLEAEFEDGAVRVRVRERTDAVEDDADDDDDDATPPERVDNSGPGSVNSGPGSVNSGRGTEDDGDDDGPDHEVGDDSGSHSGSGSSGSGGSNFESGSSGSGSGD